MRLEGERRRGLSQPLGAVKRGCDHRLMAAMHPVEIADGDDRAAQGVIGRAIAHDEEAFCRHRASMMINRLAGRRCRAGTRKVKAARPAAIARRPIAHYRD